MNQYIVISLVAIVLYVIFYYRGESEPTQHEVQTMAYVSDPTGAPVGTSTVFDKFKTLAYPQISHDFKKLTKGDLQPLKDAVSSVPESFTRVRETLDTDTTMSPTRMYLPDYYRKDTMGASDIGTSEMRPFAPEGSDETQDTDDAWTDGNVAENPTFYNSTQEPEELTNIGGFFDNDNQYNDTTSSNTRTLPSDNCYTNKQGSSFCMTDTRMQVVPPEIVTNPQDGYYLNPEGMYKDYNRIPVDPNRVMNGGGFYNSVVGSQPIGTNERPAPPIGVQVAVY
jgi:hypothetical protein